MTSEGERSNPHKESVSESSKEGGSKFFILHSSFFI